MTTTTTTELAVLRAVGLKGRTDAVTVAGLTGVPESDAVLRSAEEQGTVKAAGDRFRLTPDGRARLAALLAEERATVDRSYIDVLYERFHTPNTRLKQLMTDWQMRDGQPNDHGDRAYDEGVAAQLADLHRDVAGLVGEIAAAAPRLARYPQRLEDAAARVAAGDHGWLAKPLIDSYHTVWFELHEELIGLLGLERAAEAEAGRAL